MYLCKGDGSKGRLPGARRYGFHYRQPLYFWVKTVYDYYMIKNETKMSYEQQFKTTALTATIALHNELVNDDAFAGYEADINAFNTLYKEVYTITRYELFDGADVEMINETFYTYMTEIANGEREVDWYLY